MEAESDESLMVMINQGDKDAFTCLLQRHIKPVHGHVYRFFQDQALADDLCQETFLRVWNKAYTWRAGKVKFTTWLHRITHNLCIDQKRKIKPAQEYDDEQTFSNNIHAVEQLQEQQMAGRVRVAVANLPESQRSALILCQFQGLSNKEAAEVQQISVRALESLLARARRSLKKQLIAEVNYG